MDSSPFRTIGDKSRLVDRVVDEIQRLIVEGHLEPGMKLPPERDLAEQIGVSRTVVREAVRSLVARGLLATKHGVGTVVQQVTEDHVSASLNLLLKTRSVSLDKLHEVRSILEVEIAGMAAQQAAAEDIVELQRILQTMDSVQQDKQLFAEKDAEFHSTLAKMTHNPLFSVLLDSIAVFMHEVRLTVSQYPDLFAAVMPDHYHILECVTRHDVEGARQGMRAHLEHARKIQQLFVAEQERTRISQPLLDQSNVI